MNTLLKHCQAVLCICLLVASAADAQTNPATELNLTLGEQRVKFAPTRSFQEMRLEVVNHAGETVFTHLTTDAEFDWDLRAGNGEPLSAGLYSYVLTLKFSEERLRQHRGNLIVEQGNGQGQQQVWLTAEDGATVSGASLNAVRSGGRSVAGIKTSENKAANRSVAGREIAGEKGNQLTKDQKPAKQEKFGVLATGNQLAKFAIDGVTLIDSLVTEIGGNVGIGTTTPVAVLDMVKPGATDVVFRMANGTRAWSVGVSGTGDFWRIRDNTTGAARLAVSGTNGNVGIGTTAPAHKLDVAGTINTTTQYDLNGSRVLSNSGSGNLFAGVGAGQANISGNNNTFFGKDAGLTSTSSSNSFFGTGAGDSNTVGNSNAFFGIFVGSANSTGSNNAFFGPLAGETNFSGDNNAFFGSKADFSNIGGNNNTVLGADANVNAVNLNFATALGAGAVVSNSNSVVLGRSADTVRVPGSAIVTGDLTINGQTIINNFGAAGANSHICVNGANEVVDCTVSSERHKKNVAPLKAGLAEINRLRPVNFTWKTSGEADFGLIAEEVAEAAPLLAVHDKDGTVKGVNYDKISVVMINAMKEQQAQIQQQQGQIQQMLRANRQLRQRLTKVERRVKTQRR